MNADLKIIDYRPEFKHRWKAINEEWIEESFWMEAIDHQHCSEPEKYVLANGGIILLAQMEGEIVGTAGLIREPDGVFELIKMAVDKRYRGRGAGRKICEAAIERARVEGAKMVYLFSNTKGAGDAIGLYRRLGFVEVPLSSDEFERADIQMELWFASKHNVSDMEKLKFPLGRFQAPESITEAHRSTWISNIATLPGRLEVALATMTDAQLDTPYRPGGWTVRQVIHHLADSHSNAFIRIRLALTEENPAIKPYEQDEWVKLPDAGMPVQPSLDILRGLHVRWAFLLKNLEAAELKRTFFHPVSQRVFTVEEAIGTYSHHGDNHLAQITSLKERMDW